MRDAALRFDAVVVGGGPAGATAADDLARAGRAVLLLDRAGRVKPCGGAIPPKVLEEFEVPESILVARVHSARMVPPSNRSVEMPIENGFVGMVDRGDFDEWLRARAARSGAHRRTGTFERIERESEVPGVWVHYRTAEGDLERVHTRLVIGADGANSAVARAEIPGAERAKFVFAYHEIVRTPTAGAPGAPGEATRGAFDGDRCDVIYQGSLSPDFYSWIFPHGATVSVGTGTARKGFSQKRSVAALRKTHGLDGAVTVRCEGAPIPMRPLPRWDNGRDVILAGDAAGVVAPASGEGIYYAMTGGRLAADAAIEFLAHPRASALASARRRFMRAHGRVFWILGIMQRFWYVNEHRRERFVRICEDRDVQRLTWEAYLNKRLVRARPLAHARIFFKDLAHLLGLVRV